MSRAPTPRPAREILSDADDDRRAPADVANEIASELNLLSSSWTNPGAFLERRDFLTKRLRRLSRRLAVEPASRRSPTPAEAAPYARAERARSLEAPPGRPPAARPILTLPRS